MKIGMRKINPHKVDHDVHLPRHGWVLLRELHTLTSRGKYLCPNRDNRRRPTSNFGILTLSAWGMRKRWRGHGFRSLAMGVLKRDRDTAIRWWTGSCRTCLAVTYGEAYDREMFLHEQKFMMQEYTDYLAVNATGELSRPARLSQKLRRHWRAQR